MNGIELDLVFKNPLYVSTGDSADTLIATFNKNELYMDAENPLLEVLPNGWQVPVILPPQMPKLSEVEAKPEQATQGVILLQFFLTFVLGFSAASFVGMINSLQITAHLPLNNIPYVYPCRETFETLIAFVSFDILPGEAIEAM